MTFLGTLWIAYGFARQKLHVFLATGLTPAGANPDAEEHDLVLRTASIADFEQMLLDGTIQDSCTVAAWASTVSGRIARDNCLGAPHLAGFARCGIATPSKLSPSPLWKLVKLFPYGTKVFSLIPHDFPPQ